MPVKDAIATVLNRNSFYRDGYRMMLRITMIQGTLIALLIAAIVGLALTMKTENVYFATTSDGRIINIVPLNEPYLSQAQVIAWAASTAQNVMRFGYHDYRERLQQASANFTTTGWDSFNKALKEANFIDAIEARKLVVTMDILGAPEVQSEFVNKEGVYNWYVVFPVLIKFDGQQPPQAMRMQLRLQLVRVSTLQNPDGVSIEQWLPVQPGKK